MKVHEVVAIILAAPTSAYLQIYCDAELNVETRDVFESAERRLRKQVLRRTFESCNDLRTATALGENLPKKSEEASWWEDWLIILSWQTLLEASRPSLTQFKSLTDLPLSVQQADVGPSDVRDAFEIMNELDKLIPALAACTDPAEAYRLYNTSWSQIDQLPYERWVELADQEALAGVLGIKTSAEAWAKLMTSYMPESSYHARAIELEAEESASSGSPAQA